MDITQHNIQKKNGVSYGTLTLIIIVTLLVAFLVFKNLGSIGNWIGGTIIQQTTGFTIGQSVALSGEILQNGDYVTHTHTLTTLDHGVVGLKSRTLDLNQYSGVVVIQGVVEKLQNSLFIVEVTAISGSSAGTGSTTINTMQQLGSYVSNAGIYLPYDFGSAYTLDNSSAGQIAVTHLSTNQKVIVSYFPCTTTDPNKNCAQMVKNFSANADKTFTNNNGDKFYKLEGINSRFAVNGDFYGYFINDVPEQEVRDLANAMIILNKDYVDAHLLSLVTPLCTDNTTTLQSVTTHSVSRDLNYGLVLSLQGNMVNGTAQCKVVLDPSNSQGGQKLSYTPTVSSSTTTTTSSTTSTTPSSLDFSVKQFPINMAKALTYTSSSKGYTMVLPSSNISYAGVPLNEDFEIAGLRCTAQMNVIKFSDKALLATNPTVKIFECTAKKDITLPSNSFLQTKLSDGRIFLIEIMDGAWKDFASNISISLMQ